MNPDGRENHARNKRNKETVKERQTGLAKRPAKLEKDAEKRKIAVVVATLFITVVTFLIFGKNVTCHVLYFLCGLRMLDTMRCMNEPFETIFPTFAYFLLSSG